MPSPKTVVKLSKRTFSAFLNQHLTQYHKTMLVRRMKRYRHGDDVTGDDAKTGDTFSVHCRFSAVIKALIALHEQGFIPVFNYVLRKCMNANCIPTIIYQLLPSSLLTLIAVTCERYRFG